MVASPILSPAEESNIDFKLDITVPASHEISITLSPRKRRALPHLSNHSPSDSISSPTKSVTANPSVTPIESATIVDAVEFTGSLARDDRITPIAVAAQIPSHRRGLTNGSVNYSVSPETRAAFPPPMGRPESGRKAWYIVGRGYDIGVFYDEW
jgi:hypothetical protein